MMVRHGLLVALLAVLLAGNAGAIGYYASGVVGDWHIASTWGGAGTPQAADTAYLNLGSTVTLTGTDEEVHQLHHASWSGNSDLVTLTITDNGSLTVADWAYLGVAAGDVGELNIENGGTFTCNSAMNVGFNGHCTMNVNGGTVHANGGLFTSNPWQTAGTGSGTINVIAGTINVGTPSYSDFAMSSAGSIDIQGGIIRIYGLWFDTLLAGYISSGQIIGYGGASAVGISHEGDYTVLGAVHPLQPDPADGAGVSAGVYTLRWVLPEPEVTGGTVSCDVYLTDNYPEAGAPGDPNFLLYATKIVNNQVQESIVWTLDANKDYYWRIDVYDSSSAEPQPTVNKVFTFNTYNQAPIANAGADVPTWLTNGSAVVNLLGSVWDDGLPGPYTVAWEVTSEPAAGAATIDPLSADQLDIAVTMTQEGEYVLQLTADDGQLDHSDTLIITVYPDSCEAAKGTGVEMMQSDFNEDCTVDLLDLGVFASEWLSSTAL